MGAAQERFDRLLKEVWGPTLRESGLTGSGKVWTLPDDLDWGMIGFQSSWTSTADEVRFTINLLVVGKLVWEEARAHHRSYPRRPSPNTLAPHRYLQRAGFLSHGSDHWWRLAGDGSNENQISPEIRTLLRDLVIPKLKTEMADQSPGPRGTFESVSEDPEPI